MTLFFPPPFQISWPYSSSSRSRRRLQIALVQMGFEMSWSLLGEMYFSAGVYQRLNKQNPGGASKAFLLSFSFFVEQLLKNWGFCQDPSSPNTHTGFHIKRSPLCEVQLQSCSCRQEPSDAKYLKTSNSDEANSTTKRVIRRKTSAITNMPQ